MSASESARLDLVSLLGSFPVEGAIFTTYTLSLTWFEVYLLRQLERQGVARVAVLADAEGVEMSLREGLARGPGIRYALEAIRLPCGVMHAKVAVVWGGEKLIIAVGSGNLTLPGMQRNLEVWDVLVSGFADARPDSMLTQSVADGVSGFLSGVRGHLHAAAWATRVVDEAKGAILTVQPSLPNTTSPRWLDSCAKSIGDQVVGAIGRAPRAFEWLSPFHGATGDAALKLGRETGATANTLLFVEKDTTFPLKSARKQGKIEARRISGDARPLHAKVYRWREADASHILTGSANATETALWTTMNIEACLLRTGAKEAWGGLLDSEPAEPTERADPQIDKSKHRLHIVSARAGTEGVRLWLHWDGPTPESVRVTYIEHDEESELPWAESVTVALPAAHDAMRPRPLRVEAEVIDDGGLHRARAWVSFDEWLNASPTFRRHVTQLARLLGAEGGDEEDRIEILNLFTEEHARTLGCLSEWKTAPGGHGTAAAKAPPDLPIPVRLLLLAGEQDSVGAGAVGALPQSGTVDGVLRAMREAFLSLEAPVPAEGEDDEDPTPPTAGQRAAIARHATAVEAFEDKFFDVVRATERCPPRPDFALAYAAFCMRLAVKLRLRAEDPSDGMLRSLERWVNALLQPRHAGAPLVLLMKAASPPEEFVGLAAAAIAVLASRAQQAPQTESRRRSDRLPTSALREALDALDRLGGPAFARMPDGLADALPAYSAEPDAALAALRALPSRRQRMIALDRTLRRLASGDPAEDAPTDADADEAALLATAQGPRPPRRILPWSDTCPACHGTLAAQAHIRLAAGIVQRCAALRCGVWLLPLEGT